MRYALAFALLLCSFSSDVMAGKFVIPKGTTYSSGLVVNNTTNLCNGSPCTGVVNKGTISNPGGTGLTVSGTPAQTVVNKGTITGQTGLSVTGTSSSVIVNSGVIKGTNVGVSQLP